MHIINKRNNFFYSINKIRRIEKIASKIFKIAPGTLMYRAGKSIFSEIKVRWPKIKNVTIICGNGNNAGDGYVVAFLAHRAKYKVKILQISKNDKLIGPALKAAKICKKLGIMTLSYISAQELLDSDLIIDGLIGIGLHGTVNEEFKKLFYLINNCQIPILSIDIPSGVNGDSGEVIDIAIKANVTVTFIGIKVGMLLSDARDYTGEIIVNNLNLPKKIFDLVPPSGEKLCIELEKHLLSPRKRNVHKGNFGRILVVGGNHGMGGAVRMTGEALLAVGAGLVSIITRPMNAMAINIARPEILSYGIDYDYKAIYQLIKRASIIIIGPGMGTSVWSQQLFDLIIKSSVPMLIDADGLNILATRKLYSDNWILTPHLYEAARLLNEENVYVKNNKLEAAKKIQKKFGGVIVLKGSGTIIIGQDNQVAICDNGNPGMAVAGMGDVLSGIIAGLLAQNLNFLEAAKLGVLLHAIAGDLVSIRDGEIGISAMDIIPMSRFLVNNLNKR